MAIYWAFRLAALWVRVFPLRASYALARLGGLCVFFLWRGGRRRCIANMRRVAGGDESAARRLARRSFGYYGLYIVDFLRLTDVSAREVRRRVIFDEWQQLDEARAGSGVLFVTIHFGNWDLGAASMTERGYPVSVIADAFAEPRLHDLVFSSRRRIGLRILPAGHLSLRLVRALRHNEIVGVLADVPQPEGGVEVDFFGGTIAVPDGAARLALRTGASVVAATVPRLGPWSDQFTGDFQLVECERTGDREHDVRSLTQAMFRVFEEMVRARPEQWYIFRPLWPEDAAAEAAS
ncbi:MAG: hypothetical protein F4X76_13255 [Chloroflexi bacterium]|nr:hypothetical protein [Chloroflexota bacterium]